ncbi:MAG: hypothetical protein A3I11_05060 [Elusimicrobia bacterium RIFCSPLOWO2_02_FULL_39_32]|nr:MAG: hypothetical protein A2034_00945 [Elusimicrobia bacterium GWA2_38_7]OGR80081.1 MAG: hypothetical protein A3B80_00545 [Elusimicrobia bacterium RIFCSPHIGHO2_02_FULL_39_36]OGR91124.1 MAG: hypothetical protein A3I11_05060 [Elusimicrobia bacterium RIFCSPLOWO2_02_FULL_39_32]OGS00091.1 MAG: hypothetical protein A3G85_08025 [Elusimicrobia bacterium RIFCSPLOWO2_12_FULL_39_28]
MEQTESAAANSNQIVEISSKNFLGLSVIVSVIVFIIGAFISIPIWFIALEVLVTILSLFVFGSIRYRLDKNALTYGAVLVIGSTFFWKWWPNSFLRTSMQTDGLGELWEFLHHYLLTLHGLDQLVHADTMLFILGLTFFVSVIAQTRLLETVSFKVLEKTKGNALLTILILTGLVSFASGILDGVSMIGLMIRTLVIILFLAKAKDEAILYAVMIATIITTVCGMWLAYGEPPNLIMKANLHPYLDNAFFLRYCLPIAVGSYCIVAWNIKRKLGKVSIQINDLDILDTHTADVRFLQAEKHGEVLIPVEFIDSYEKDLGVHLKGVTERLHNGEPLGSAMVREGVPEELRKKMLGHFITEELQEALDQHYIHLIRGENDKMDSSYQKIKSIFETIHKQRIKSQIIGGISFIPFIGFLVWHGMNHHVPLFLASFAGFFVAFLGIFNISKMRNLSLKEAKHEYVEYLFLFPLFLSITLLQKTGFFNQIAELLRKGIELLGASHVAFAQFIGATFLSAILDNNVVADFTSRGLHGLETGILYLFSMAQIAGYALGGCWTHIGSAQSVVAYAFIRKEVDEHFTPFQWIKAVTPTILEILIFITLVVYGEGLLLRFFAGH